ncbi:DUF1573 domain-containing protein [Flavobacteriaceae bacterium]|jgi:hypothetical protein|nr:DUF1573 domain-containing protein [Flavobacteriaceae bacterium]MDC1492502.1 DUF1573 domain-containing protein [Flavobacteriaceae bacterium]
MKNLIIILSVVFLNSNIYAQKKGAIIEFESSTIDYGTIEKGDNGLRVFKFTNTGDSPLIVTKVKASCGCTVPKKPNKPILPGDSGEIEVKYDTRRVMPFKKTISVGSNALNSTVLLTIKGKVEDNSNAIIVNKKPKSLVEEF